MHMDILYITVLSVVYVCALALLLGAVFTGLALLFPEKRRSKRTLKIKRAVSEETTQTQYSLSSGAANVKEVTK